MDWQFHNPQLEYERDFFDVTWPWAGHKRFAYDLIRNIKPAVLVELGTHKATSLYSFAQAAKDGAIDVQLNAVDSWSGDEHAGFYQGSVYAEVQGNIDKYYSSVNVVLHRKLFEEALNDFDQGSVDVLHIDGLHTYEAVREDFETWLPKMKSDGIVLFHDIKVMERGFGVYQFWKELKQKYKTIEFYHSYGLGVLFLDASSPAAIAMTQKESEMQMHYSYIHEVRKGKGSLGNPHALIPRGHRLFKKYCEKLNFLFMHPGKFAKKYLSGTKKKIPK